MIGTDLVRRSGAVAVALLYLLCADASPVAAQPTSWSGPVKKGRKFKVLLDSAPQQAAVYL